MNNASSPLPLTAMPEAHPTQIGWVIDATGVTWESATAALTMGVLDLCGCGYADQRDEDFLAVLRAVHTRWETTEEAKGKTTPIPEHIGTMYGELILGVLDTAGLLQHGGSVGGAWLTDLGRQWLAALNAHTPTDPNEKR